MPSPAVPTEGRVVPERLLETHLSRVLFAAQAARATGVLTVDEGYVRTLLHVADGRIVFVDAGTVAETLGRVLMRAGKLDRDEYVLILEQLSERSGDPTALRFGDVALRLGMLSPADLAEALAVQVREKLLRCLQIDEAAWWFQEGPEGRYATPYPTPLEPALLDALRTDPQRHRWAGLLTAKRNRHVHLRHEADDVARRFGATPAELRLLGTVDGRPLGSLLVAQFLPREETGALLAAILLADELVIGRPISEPSPRAAPGPASPPPDDARASPDAERRAPRAGAGGGDDDRAREIAARLREEIRRRPSGTALAAAEREPDARLSGERAFERGRRLLARGAIEGARDAFERAAQLVPGAADYLLHLTWSRYLGETDPEPRKALEQLLRADVLEALRQDRTLAFGHYVQGRIFLLDGDDRAAHQAFTIAARLDPQDLESTRYLRLLSRRLS